MGFKYEQGQIFKDKKTGDTFFVSRCLFAGFMLNTRQVELLPIPKPIVINEDNVENYYEKENKKIKNWIDRPHYHESEISETAE